MAGKRLYRCVTLMFLPVEPAIFRKRGRPGARRAPALVAAHNHVILMRDIFSEIFENQPLDPRESARRGARPKLRKRFYNQAHVGEAGAGGVPLLLDGKPVKTPKRRALAAPTRALAEKIAEEWNAQADLIDPGRMPLTRLANAVIDAVADAAVPVADEVAKYLGSDLLARDASAPGDAQARTSWGQSSLLTRFQLCHTPRRYMEARYDRSLILCW
jgi:ATP12 chaperone protein